MNKFEYKFALLNLYIKLYSWKKYFADIERINAMKILESEKKKLRQTARNQRFNIGYRFERNAANRKWQGENTEKCAAQRKVYYQENSEKIMARCAKWRVNNRAKSNAISLKANRKFREENPGIYKIYKKRYKKKQIEQRIEQGRQHINNNSMLITAAELRRQFERGS